MIKRLLALFLVCSTLMFAVDAQTQKEIDHLLTYVKETPCTYVRNGTAHKGKEAAEHIRAKYEHFKEKVKTTEDFIRFSATKSLITGSPYYIECPGKSKVPSAQWLLSELKHFRNK